MSQNSERSRCFNRPKRERKRERATSHDGFFDTLSNSIAEPASRFTVDSSNAVDQQEYALTESGVSDWVERGLQYGIQSVFAARLQFPKCLDGKESFYQTYLLSAIVF